MQAYLKPVFGLVFALALGMGSSQAQIFDPVSWSWCQNKVSDNEYELVFTATIEDGWHMYSLDAGEGPVSTSFDFLNQNEGGYALNGKIRETKPIKKYDPNFLTDLKYFEHSATFRQLVKAEKGSSSVKGELTFMVCTDSNCLAPEYVDFTFQLPGKTDCDGKPIVATSAGGDGSTSGNSPPDEKSDAGSADEGATAAESGDENGSGETAESGDAATNPADTEPKAEKSTTASTTNADGTHNYNNLAILEAGCGDEIGGEVDESFWGIFIAGFLGGLIALLTPCVFPMIPLTVSFFTKQSKTKAKGITNALIYGISIIVIYVVLGMAITLSMGPDALNAMASNGWFNFLFFVIFVVFAMSFFGAFEITLPSSWINKADSASDKGGLIGIFFMAFTLCLVSFSCTGPIIGTLLVEAATGAGQLGPAIGMFGFALALALPFALFAAFPGWLNSLPQSGGWLNSVKVTLGFIELALALKFLSVVDLAYHWDILYREIFLALWIIIFVLLGFYLLGKLKFSHDSPLTHISVPRLMFAVFSFAFAIYLVPGLWGAPVKLMSGIAPPSFHKEWKSPDEGHCPHGLNCFHDYEEGMAYAKKEGKPVMIDFTGWSCVNCRKMEDNVWPTQQIFEMIEQDYVLISLYVDDKERLPADKQYTSETTGKKIKTVGSRWSDMEASRYGQNSQPLYVLLDHEENLLAKPTGYTPDAEEYAKFLNAGLCRFEKRVAAKEAADRELETAAVMH